MEDKTNKTGGGGGGFFSARIGRMMTYLPHFWKELFQVSGPDIPCKLHTKCCSSISFFWCYILCGFQFSSTQKSQTWQGQTGESSTLKIALFTLLLLVSLVSVYGSKYLSRCCSTGLLLPSLPSCSSLLLCLLGLGLWLALLCLPLHIPPKNKQTNSIFNYWGLHSQ